MKISAPGRTSHLDPANVDLFDPEFYASGDPHPLWARMRAHHPLHRQELPDGRTFVSVTRHADALRVLGDHRAFTSTRGSLLHQLGQPEAAAGSMLVATDPPAHTRLRRGLNPVLTAKAVRSREPDVRRLVRRILSTEDDVWDLAACAARLPMAVAGTLMGLPEEDWPRLSRWTDMAASPHEPTFCLKNPAVTLATAHHSLFEYFTTRLRQRAGKPGDDLVGHLMTMAAGKDGLTTAEVVFNCYSLLLGANATTPHTITATILALVERPGIYPVPTALVPSLVEEGLRWASPANSFLRHAVGDVRLSAGMVRDGEAVAVWVGSANRDERVFSEPYRFDVTRIDNRHIAFGHGPHYCVGAPLARMTLRIFFEELFLAFDRIEPAGPVSHLASTFVSGMTRFPIRTRPARVPATGGVHA